MPLFEFLQIIAKNNKKAIFFSSNTNFFERQTYKLKKKKEFVRKNFFKANNYRQNKSRDIFNKEVPEFLCCKTADCRKRQNDNFTDEMDFLMKFSYKSIGINYCKCSWCK